jgi:uncharacterized UBP type Zn finger protein
LDEQAKTQNKLQLLSMGFEEWLVDEALTKNKGLEPALNWITMQLDGASKPTGEQAEVDSESLAALTGMGFDEEMARQSLVKTKVSCCTVWYANGAKGDVEAAANWLFEHM